MPPRDWPKCFESSKEGLATGREVIRGLLVRKGSGRAVLDGGSIGTNTGLLCDSVRPFVSDK